MLLMLRSPEAVLVDPLLSPAGQFQVQQIEPIGEKTVQRQCLFTTERAIAFLTTGLIRLYAYEPESSPLALTALVRKHFQAGN